MSSKKYGGVIHGWSKSETYEEYKVFNGVKTLGFVIYGTLFDDPTGRFGHGPLRTSLVVSFNKNRIETLNTIYDLGEKANG